MVFDFTTRRSSDVENRIAKVVAGSSLVGSVKSKMESSMCVSEVADFDRLVVIPTSGLQQASFDLHCRCSGTKLASRGPTVCAGSA